MDNNCVDCYKIICQKCKWEPNEQETQLIRAGEIKKCSKCGWSPPIREKSSVKTSDL